MRKPAALLFSISMVLKPSTSIYAGIVIKTYAPDTSNFPNPERGFYIQTDVSSSALLKARQTESITLIRAYFRLDAWRNSLLPQTFLTEVEKDMNTVRESGAKIIPRFSYNFGPDSSGLGPDAPVSRVLEHIGQIEPILKRNSDIIVGLEAGFVGAWGEWHSSENRLTELSAKEQILTRLLNALPLDRMVLLRTQKHKKSILGNSALILKEAYSGIPRSRVGAHNDCLGASQDDWGTYSSSPILMEQEKDWYHQDNQYVMQEGETCNPSAFSICAPMLKDLSRMRWDALNIDYHETVLSSWKTGGCMPEIRKRLGYRFKLVSAQLQDSVRVGGLWHFQIKLVNDGWGKAFNFRKMWLVFLSNKGSPISLPINANPRLWLADDTVRVEGDLLLPINLLTGNYQTFLHLPDTAQRLAKNSRYSIRFANQGVWEDSTGFNSLNHSVVVETGVPIYRKQINDLIRMRIPKQTTFQGKDRMVNAKGRTVK